MNLEDDYEQYQFQKKFVDIILKLMCYYPVSVFSYDAGRLIESPSPRVVVDLVRNNESSLGILLGRDTLFMLEKRCLNMAVYNPDYGMREMISRIAGAERLFWREPGLMIWGGDRGIWMDFAFWGCMERRLAVRLMW